MTRDKDCFCHTCQRRINHLGIAAHRAMHRRKFENCTITYSDGSVKKHLFGKVVAL